MLYTSGKHLDKIERAAWELSAWELELHVQLLISDLNSIRLSPYRAMLTGHEPDPQNETFRQMVQNLLIDIKQCPEGMEKILSPRAFEMLISEAARQQTLAV